MTLHQKPNTLQTDSFWMPFTANRQFKKAPRLFASAEGMHYTTVDGRKVIDGSAGLWCVNAGHGRRQIATAVERQLTNLDFAPSFNMGHPLAFDFAERLAEIAPKGIDRIFFTNSGSESVDTALKIALAYQRAIGQGTRTRLIGRERGYHGVGFGGMSVGGMVANRRAFATHLPGVDHIRHTHDLGRNAFAKDQPEHGAELADDLERMVALHGADTIAAVIVEPVPGSTAVLPPPKGYLKRLREIADKHGILLIFDEVITGFGRLGAPFAADYFGVTPDMMTTAKGITNGTVPCGAPQIREGPDEVVEEHDAEARDDHVEAARLESVDLRVGTDEACRRAFQFGAGPGGGDHRIRNVDADAAARRAEQPRDGERCAARAVADVDPIEVHVAGT